MSEDCENRLFIIGDEDKVLSFFSFLEEKDSEIGSYFFNLEKEAEDIEEDLELNKASQRPYADTFDIDFEEKTVTWDSRNYPSLLAVYELSKQFIDLEFALLYESMDGGIAGYTYFCNGQVTKDHTVDFDDAVQTILCNYGKDLFFLKKGESINVGIGDLDIECIDEEDNKEKMTKTYNLQFGCDMSPVIVLHMAHDDEFFTYSLETDYTARMAEYKSKMEEELQDVLELIDEIGYSDDDGNEDISDNEYHNEMCIHADNRLSAPY